MKEYSIGEVIEGILVQRKRLFCLIITSSRTAFRLAGKPSANGSDEGFVTRINPKLKRVRHIPFPLIHCPAYISLLDHQRTNRISLYYHLRSFLPHPAP